jgi:lipopolysaccharide transport system permease protein
VRPQETLITAHRGWLDADLKGLWAYRDLIALLVRRDFVAYYKQTILGPAWFVLQPLMTTIVFTIIFSRIARLPTDGVPPFLFYMAAVVPWTYISHCVNETSNVFVANAAVFGKVYFPRLVVPVARVLTNLITLGIQLALLLACYAYFALQGAELRMTAWVAALPVAILAMALLGLAVGLLVSALTAKYRDLGFAVGFGVQLWMYASPVVYPLSQVPASWHWAFALNPVTGIVETFRHALFGTPEPAAAVLGLGGVVIAALLVFGTLLFTRVERLAADTA